MLHYSVALMGNVALCGQLRLQQRGRAYHLESMRSAPALQQSPDWQQALLAFWCWHVRNRDHEKITNPNNALSFGRIHQNYHRFALFDPPQIGNLMIPEKPDDIFLAPRGLVCTFSGKKDRKTRCIDSSSLHQGDIRVIRFISLDKTWQTLTSWWLNQPLWKICASQIGNLPQTGMKIKKNETTTQYISGNALHSAFVDGSQLFVGSLYSRRWRTSIFLGNAGFYQTNLGGETSGSKETSPGSKEIICLSHLMVWLGGLWGGGVGGLDSDWIPENEERDCYLRVPFFQSRTPNPNHQLTISCLRI